MTDQYDKNWNQYEAILNPETHDHIEKQAEEEWIHIIFDEPPEYLENHEEKIAEARMEELEIDIKYSHNYDGSEIL